MKHRQNNKYRSVRVISSEMYIVLNAENAETNAFDCVSNKVTLSVAFFHLLLLFYLEMIPYYIDRPATCSLRVLLLVVCVLQFM